MSEGTGTKRDQEAADRLRRLGAAIREARLPRTQVDLAAAVGWPQASISAWENGHVDLSVERVRLLEDELGVPAGALLRSAGYVCEPLPGHPARAFSTLTQPEPRSFAQQVSAWMGEWAPLIVAMDLLRQRAPEGDALQALLHFEPVRLLRLSWELLDRLAGNDEESEEALVRAVGSSAVATCRRALWGEGEGDQAPPVPCEELR